MPRGRPAVFSPAEQQIIGEAVRQGWTLRKISEFINRPLTVVYRYLRKPQLPPTRPEDVEPLFPVNAFKPDGPCPHGVIHDGDRVYCPYCHQTGIEDHPALQKPRPKKNAKQPAKFKPKGLKASA